MLSLCLLCLKARSATAVPEVELGTSFAFRRAMASWNSPLHRAARLWELTRGRERAGGGLSTTAYLPTPCHQERASGLARFLLPFCTSKHISRRNPHSSGPKHVCATALMAQEAIWVWPRCMPSTAPADWWERGDLPILLGMSPQSAPIKCKMLNYSHSWVCIFYLALWVLFGSHQVIECKG